MRKSWGLLLAAGVALAAESSSVTPQELKARMPADLGPDKVDVSGYPREQQENYAIFISRCSRCHTPARPINSEITTHEQWEHYVSLMHGRLESRSMKEPWSAVEGRKIVSFLTYDSQIRKVERRQEFELLQARLRERFAMVQKEKARLAKDQPTKPSAPYTGANP